MTSLAATELSSDSNTSGNIAELWQIYLTWNLAKISEMKGTVRAFRSKIKTNKKVDVNIFDCDETKMKEKEKRRFFLLGLKAFKSAFYVFKNWILFF